MGVRVQHRILQLRLIQHQRLINQLIKRYVQVNLLQQQRSQEQQQVQTTLGQVRTQQLVWQQVEQEIFQLLLQQIQQMHRFLP